MGSLWRIGVLVPLVLVSSGLWAGCDEPAALTCGVPGSTQSCVCPSGISGAQTCEASGAWGVCQCAGTADVFDTDGDAGAEVAADILAEVGGDAPSDTALDTAEEDTAPSCSPACAEYEDCTDGTCRNRYAGQYSAGDFSIVTDRGTCTGLFGFLIDSNSALVMYGVDPTTGQPDLAFSTVECSSSFQGSSLPLKIVVAGSSGLSMAPPNRIEGQLQLQMSHADFNATVDVTFSATVSGGQISVTLSGLPQSVDLGLPTEVTGGNFVASQE